MMAAVAATRGRTDNDTGNGHARTGAALDWDASPAGSRWGMGDLSYVSASPFLNPQASALCRAPAVGSWQDHVPTALRAASDQTCSDRHRPPVLCHAAQHPDSRELDGVRSPVFYFGLSAEPPLIFVAIGAHRQGWLGTGDSDLQTRNIRSEDSTPSIPGFLPSTVEEGCVPTNDASGSQSRRKTKIGPPPTRTSAISRFPQWLVEQRPSTIGIWFSRKS